MRALVVEHIVEEGAGTLADWLPAAGLDLDIHRVHADGPPATTLDPAYDALVVLGGSMGVPDADTTHRWLHDEMALIRHTVAADTPLLGVCLGAQLLASACGGAVVRGRVGPEIGVSRVHLAAAAEADPLLAGTPPIAEAVQWHWDEVLALPPGATLLAGSATYPHQAFRVGETAWGLQFHLEARLAMVRRWAEEDSAALRAAGEDPDEVVAAAERAWPEMQRTWAPVASRFASVVQEAATRRRTATYAPHVGS
jgi:GMP synthase-like glutamine amidotransferase